MSATRADRALVARGLAPTRAQAQAIIAEGRALTRRPAATSLGTSNPGAAWTPISKPSQLIEETSELNVLAAEGGRFASRGGQKLSAAFDRAGASLKGARVLDLGLSTGGFADCCLQLGAEFVLGIDVGHGQLRPELASNPRLCSIEGFNAREFSRAHIESALVRRPGDHPDGNPTSAVKAPKDAAARESALQSAVAKSFDLGFDWVVADVSFISLKLVLPPAIQYLKPGGRALALVKPQFEAGRAAVGKGGVVKDPAEHERVKREMLAFAAQARLITEDYFESSIKGADGNQEFFLLARHE